MSGYVHLHTGTDMALPQSAAMIGNKVVYIYTTRRKSPQKAVIEWSFATTTVTSETPVTPAWAAILIDALLLYIGNILL